MTRAMVVEEMLWIASREDIGRGIRCYGHT